MPMRRLLGAIAGIFVLTASAAGGEQIAPETDKILWCASAFYWLAGNADDAGDAADAELYDGWSTALVEKGSAALSAAGATPERIEEIIAGYDSRVLDELGTSDARYDVLDCPALIGEP